MAKDAETRRACARKRCRYDGTCIPMVEVMPHDARPGRVKGLLISFPIVYCTGCVVGFDPLGDPEMARKYLELVAGETTRDGVPFNPAEYRLLAVSIRRACSPWSVDDPGDNLNASALRVSF